MGHDIHFLERLERVDVGQAERALALYRNAELVKTLLAELPLPEGAERVAIALDAEEPSPHVIVSRDGHFVTCLAAEMSLGSVFRVTRPQLDGVRARHERLQTALDAAGSGQAKRVFERLSEDPEYFSREDAQLLAAVQPLMSRKLATLAGDFFEAQCKLVIRLASREEPERRHQRLKMLWKVQWGLSVLVAGTLATELPPKIVEGGEHARNAVQNWFRMVDAGLVLRATGARGLWAIARLAKCALPELKKIRSEAPGSTQIAIANMSLALVGLRYPKCRAEITKALHTPAGQATPEVSRRETLAKVDAVTRESLLRKLADPEQARAEAESSLLSWRDQTVPELTDDPGSLYFVNYNIEEQRFLNWPYECTAALPWLAHARFEDLFLPRATFDSMPPTAESLDFLSRVAAHAVIGRFEPVRAEPKIGRNEPCTCGSGKKAKRCCAA